jgi:hypothetical protein
MKKDRGSVPSLKHLEECFNVDFESGIMYWRERPIHHFNTQKGCNIFNTRQSGKAVEGFDKSNGYKVVYVEGRLYNQHRIIYFMYHKNLPKDMVIDHINHNCSDNRIVNLRAASMSDNACNRKSVRCSSSSTGLKNIHKRICKNGEHRFDVYIHKNGNCIGKTFKSLEDAISYRDQTLNTLHKDFSSFV